jgi:hypothetical protein
MTILLYFPGLIVSYGTFLNYQLNNPNIAAMELPSFKLLLLQNTISIAATSNFFFCIHHFIISYKFDHQK